MVATPIKPLSPADLAKLEHAFATNPTSDAYKPLAEAYLGMGRFMEAMVVCKKGVKAHPTIPDARILLARVYAQQGKEKKALEELVAGLQTIPANKELLRATAELQFKTGSTDEGKANLLKSHQLDANDPQTLALMSQWKVESPKAAQAFPPPVLSPKPIQLGTPGGSQKAQAETARPPAADGQPRGAIHSEGLSPRGNRAAQRSSPSVAAASPHWDLDAQVEIAARELHRKKGNRGVFLFLLLIVPIAVGGYFLFGRWKAQRNRDIKKYLTEATEQLRHDSYSSYKKASEAADKVLELDPTSTAAHGYLAYAYAVRWGEHGGGDDARRLAEEHLAAAKKEGEISSHRYAADALILAHLGKGAQAAADLERQIKDFDAQGRASPLMYLTLGLIQSNASDFEHARESLEKAQSLAPDDPRVYAALGTLYRLRGQDSEALKNFDSALRYERDHPESLLGKALLILQFDRPDYGGVTRLLKKLLDADPPPSPRQLATAYLVRALLVSRVSKEMPDYKPEYQKLLSASTGVPIDKAKAQAEVIKAEETAFTLDRQNPDLHLIKGNRLLFEGNVDGAVAEMRQAVKTDPTRSLFYIELAKALLQKPGGDKEAQEALSTAIRTIGESPRLMLMLGNVYRRQGKVEEALAQYDRAIKDQRTKNPEARLAMGSLFREKKDLTKAQEALEKASQEFVGQSGKLAATYTELGRVYEEKGDRPKADEAYQRALNADAEYAPAYFFYARFLAGDSRQSSKARATAQEYLKREPRGDFAAEAQRLAM